MKKLSLFLFLSASIFFTSCEKDNNDNADQVTNLNAQLIAGEWNLTDYQVTDGKTVTTANGQSLTTNYTSTAKDMDMIFSIKDDPKTMSSNGSFTTVMNLSTLGVSQIQEIPTYSAITPSTWEIEDDVLYITGSDDKKRATEVLESSENKLIFSWEILENFEVSGASSTTSGKLTVTLEK